ncbi:MAG: translocation/assembly module TamB domain-containing protein [Selenomonadaceae bacterium]|nr:translocation/assembly module TamB domain-containing protein [Selenomonadaceae bacterium]
MKVAYRVAASVAGLVMAATAGISYYVQTAAFTEKIASTAAGLAKEQLGVQVDVGSIKMDSWRFLTIEDVAVYDKENECIAKAAKTQVELGWFSPLTDSPVAAIKEVAVDGVEAYLTERADGSWNVMDLTSEEETEMPFRGKVTVNDAKVVGKAQGQEMTLEQARGSVDFAQYPVMELEVAALNQGAKLAASGWVSAERQVIHGETDGLQIENYLAFVPEDLLPEEIEVRGGTIDRAQVDLMRYHNDISLTGRAEYSGGRVRVMDTEVEDIRGFAAFTDADAVLSVDAAANGQAAHAAGKVSWGSGTPYLNLTAATEDFAPAALMPDIPFRGTVDAVADIMGTVANPTVDGEVTVHDATVEGVNIGAVNGKAHVRYADNAVSWKTLNATALNGKVQGEGKFYPQDMSYTAHVKADGIDLARLSAYAPEVYGLASADIDIEGEGYDLGGLKVYGSAAARNVRYQNFNLEEVDTSFFVDGDDVTIDYLSVQMPNRSHIGLEGTIMDGRKLDLAFYGGHVDLSLITALAPKVECSGWGDFKGEIHGDSSNPNLSVKFSGLHGTLLKQPFDTVKASLSGSLDGVQVDEFSLEKDGKERWVADGSIGFTGTKAINLRADCIDARMEDIAALVAPDQPITGNVSNTIRFTGTLDNPHAVGYIHFNRGSYHGMILSGMDGDYTLENGIVTLQDFHIFSPMVDMVVNGTVDQRTNLSLTARVKDIDMKRFQNKMPYEVSGHGVFSGYIFGTIANPIFDGELKSPEIVMNGLSITDVHGQITYRGNVLHLKDFGFRQEDGLCNLDVSLNTVTEMLFGRAEIDKIELASLLTLMNRKGLPVTGALSAQVDVSGTLSNPTLRLDGSIPQGTVYGYDVHDIELDMGLDDNVFQVGSITAKQGETGTLNFQGQANLTNGLMQYKLQADDLALGMFTKAAGLDTAIVGTTDIEADIGGYLNNPTVVATIQALDGGVKGTTFDALNGEVELKNGIFDIKSLVAQKRVADKDYRASAKGIVPLSALSETEELEGAAAFEQIQLTLSLDEADLSLLPVLSKYVEWAIGPTQGSITVTGTAAHPKINGTLGVPEGSIKIKQVEKPITDMQMLVVFKDTNMKVETCTGKMGSGDFTFVGEANLNGRTPTDYVFDLALNKLDVQSSFYRGPVSANLRLDQGKVFDRVLPRISGSIDFDDCLVSVPTLPDSEGELPHLLMDVTVNLGKKVHFYSPYLADMYLGGSVHFGQSTRHPKTSGTIAVKRGGTINYLKTVFKIREGEAIFNQVDSFMPSLNFFADTKLTQAKVFLSVTGPLGAAQFKLTSSPEMSETEIIQLLTLRDAYQKGQRDLTVGDILSVGLQMTVLSEIESTMRDLLFLDTFTVARGSGSAFESSDIENSQRDVYHMEMGKYLSDKVLLKFVYGVGEDTRRYGLEYEMNDRYSLTLDRESNRFIVGIEARIKF